MYSLFGHRRKGHVSEITVRIQNFDDKSRHVNVCYSTQFLSLFRRYTGDLNKIFSNWDCARIRRRCSCERCYLVGQFLSHGCRVKTLAQSFARMYAVCKILQVKMEDKENRSPTKITRTRHEEGS